MHENKLIACLLASRGAYKRVLPLLEKHAVFTPFGERVVREIISFYETDPKAESVDVELLKQSLIQENPKRGFIIQEYFAGIPVNVSVDNVLRIYEDTYKDSLRMELISCLNSKDDKRANELIEKLRTSVVEEVDEGLYNATSIEELSTHFTGNNLIPIYPTALNNILGGGVPRQSQICIMARPDVGKSTVAINLAVGAAEQGFKVLYIGNEDSAPKMVMRILSRFLRKPEAEFKETPAESYKEALERGYSNVYFKEMHPGNYSELRGWIEKINPDLVVLDQIRNMHFKTESMTMNLESGVIACRNLAKEFNLVMIVITQAGNSAAGKVTLEMEDVEWSNCLLKGTNILMFDGSLKPVETISKGELVMGMDSTPREVLATGNGVQKMYRISHKNGDSYTVNESHILTLKNVDKRTRYGVLPNALVDISLKKILANRKQLQYLKGIHVGVEYGNNWKFPIHPYLLGLWLADGFSHTFSLSSSDKEMIEITSKFCKDTQHVRTVNKNNYIIGFGQQPNGHSNKWNDYLKRLCVWKNKHIPYMYKTGKIEDRLQLLAGIIDGDGTMRGGGKHAHTFTVYSGTEKFAKEVKQLAQSVGLYAAWHKVTDTEYTVNISGDVTRIPTNLARKKATNNSHIQWQCSEITIEELEEDTYYGISVDGDNRFILGDSYIVTHNTGVAAQMDLMIGLGQNQELKNQNMIVMSFPKNKFTAPIKPIAAHIDYSLNRITVDQ